MYANTNFVQWLEWERGSDVLKPHLQKAMTTTILDVLSTRTDAWMTDRTNQPAVESRHLKTVWNAALELEQRGITMELRRRAEDFLEKLRTFPFGTIGWNNEFNNLITHRKSELLHGPDDWLSVKKGRYEQWQRRLSAGDIPAFSELPESYTKNWLKDRENGFEEAARQWRPKPSLTSPIDPPTPSTFQRFSETRELARQATGIIDFAESLSHPFAATRVLIEALSRVPPADLRDHVDVSIPWLVHRSNFGSSDIIWEPYKKRSEVIARNQAILSRYRRYLSNQGISFDEDIYSRLVSTKEADSIYGHGNSLAMLFGIEAEFRSWQDSLEERLRNQIKEPAHYLEEPPKQTLDQYRHRYTKSRERLVNTITERRRKTEDWITKLQNYRVIMATSSFVA